MNAQNNVGRSTKGGWGSYCKRYGLALILTLGALILRQCFSSSLQHSMIFGFSSIAIALSAWQGGWGPGLFATALSTLFALYWFIEPRGSFAITSTQALGNVSSFLIIGGALSLIIEALHRSRRQAGAQADRFRTLFERASLGNALVDPATGRFLLVNRKFSEITGYGEQELLGMTFRHLIYPEDREEAEACFGRLVRGEIAEYAAERLHVRSDGRVIWVELLVTLTHATDGQPFQVLGSIQDITRRKQMEEALRESESRFRQVIRSAGSAIIGVDMTGRITMYNGQAQQVFGYTEQEVLGQHVVGTIVPPHDAQGRDMHSNISDLLHHIDQHLYNENENQTKDGRRLWMGWTNRPIQDPDGSLREIVCVGLDLTERKRAEDALRLSEDRFRATYDHAPVGIVQVGLDGQLLEVNDALCRMLGYTRAELLGRNFVELTHPEDRAAEDKLLKQLLLGETSSYQLEQRYLRKGGESVWVRGTSSLTHQPHSYRISIIEDITANRQAESFHQERSFLRQVIDAAPSLIFVKDWEGRFILANETLARGYGTSIQGIVGKTDADLNPNVEELERFWRDDHKVMSEREELLIPEERVTFADGGVHWFSTIKVPLLNEDGTCNKVMGVASDITERKRAEEALRLSEEQYRTVMETIPQMVWTIQPDGLHDFCNHHWYDYTGLSLEQTINSGWAQVLHPDDVPGAVDAWRRAFDAGEPCETEARLRRAADGVYRWHYTRILPVRDANQQIVKWVGASVDIHERHMAQDALHEANAQLAGANRQKDEFLAMLAHELRNPLAPIRNAVQILRVAGGRPDVLDRQQNIIDRQVSHMSRLLEDLLDVSRITRGTVVLQKQTLDLADVLAHAIETTAPLMESRHHTLHVTLPPCKLHIEGDIDRLAQVVGNLLANAAKYTDEGGHIWVEGRREQDQAVISVRDSGIGIAPEMLPHVFELFAQADHSLARSRGGLGIGLTMVHKLVKLHGGTIEAHSEGLCRGSEFIVRLPAPADAPPDREKAPPLSTCRVEGRQGACQTHRILVVDDVIDSAASLTELLELWGHEVRMTHDGPSALTEARSFHPEVVLLDIGMPDMDGYEVAHLLRIEHGTGMMLVALTGYGQPQDRETALAAGFDHHLVKPVDIDSLRDLLSRALVSHM